MEKSRKLKNCRVCKKEFVPWSSIQKYCRDCGYEAMKQANKTSRVLKKAKIKPKVAKPKKVERKIKLRDYKALRKDAWRWWSRLVRFEEKGQCYTCPKKEDPKVMDAGHFKHRDCMDFVRKNIHCQCTTCNRYRSGNLDVYAVKLENQYGMGILQELDGLSQIPRKYSREELEIIIEEGKKKVNKN